ncbi:hypothetical protein JS44_02095 [Anoxybacillus flavithermus]|uniref:Uncharacterized protein n=1 Tax=Anoxybacillus flavithermus TaxID=33934 RepID=A0A094LCB3_9BACL|nr:hypothetical protein JS44_02095 [Anoxybacillus flavithermus]
MGSFYFINIGGGKQHEGNGKKKLVATFLSVLLLFIVVSMFTYNRLETIDKQYSEAMKKDLNGLRSLQTCKMQCYVNKLLYGGI